MDGLILIDKPSGPTSFDVVARVRRSLGVKRVGHTGTLDPLASGLMGILVGRATKLSPYLTMADKGYEAVIRLGQTSNTYDSQGEITEVANEGACARIDRSMIETVLAEFRGQIEQVPPIFSAIKIKGERAYAKARRGEILDMPARMVRVDQLDVLGFDEGHLTVSVSCSKGTYIRSLAHDIGQRLGVGGVMTALRRTHVGQWSICEATSLTDFCELDPALQRTKLVSMWSVLSDLPVFESKPDEIWKIRNGVRFAVSQQTNPGRYRVADEDGGLLAIVAVDDARMVKVERGMPPRG
ncbi:MAG: tRNA pseudouridine(55) synthase TruB [Myxococcota bacterium]|nr:tRNA pseudouridine(55) synthase TruB [Myxococcota bacterium]